MPKTGIPLPHYREMTRILLLLLLLLLLLRLLLQKWHSPSREATPQRSEKKRWPDFAISVAEQ